MSEIKHEMNANHVEFLSSPRWAAMLEEDLLPWVMSIGELGDDVLEVGPGPGLTTDLLRARTAKLTAVELDPELAAKLTERLAATNVEVLNATATDLPFPDDRFSAAACFAVMHHVESVEQQDQIFSEILRVLRPGGVLVGSDGFDNEGTRNNHAGMLFLPLDPDTLPDHLKNLGYAEAGIDRGEYDFRFYARK